jgi:hypothetical protein
MSDDLPDDVMLADFQRLLEMGEASTQGESRVFGMAALIELTRFIDLHGRRLHQLAHAAHVAFERHREAP